MELLKPRKYSKPAQYFVSIMLVLLVATACYFSIDFIGNKVVALLLLMIVSLLAMLFDILPVLVASALSALIWNFFFIPPVYTFHIHKAEDLLMFLLYFVIASVNAALTFKIRKAENKGRDREEKENTIKLYNTLLNSLSHELRTPISTIIGAVDTLKESKDKLSIDNQIELLNQIETASLRLNRQVDNLLNMSRLETGMLKPNLDWCDLNELINSVIQKANLKGNQKVEFSPNERLPLYKIDRGLIKQVLQNLVHNAISYTSENTIITVEASQQSDNCVIVVSDDGKGIPENEIPFVFDKFYRIPNSKTGGSGLGLSIVKGFIEAHNGSIKLGNNIEGGAKFTIEIPAEASYLNNLKNE